MRRRNPSQWHLPHASKQERKEPSKTASDVTTQQQPRRSQPLDVADKYSAEPSTLRQLPSSLPIYVSVSLSMYPSVCLSMYPSLCLCIRLSTFCIYSSISLSLSLSLSPSLSLPHLRPLAQTVFSPGPCHAQSSHKRVETMRGTTRRRAKKA